jgi:hypothetical protein
MLQHATAFPVFSKYVVSRGFIEGPAGLKDAACMRRSVAQSEERRPAPRGRLRICSLYGT